MRTSINDIFIVSLRYFPECPIYRHHYNAKISKREPLFAFFFYHDGNCFFPDRIQTKKQRQGQGSCLVRDSACREFPVAVFLLWSGMVWFCVSLAYFFVGTCVRLHPYIREIFPERCVPDDPISGMADFCRLPESVYRTLELTELLSHTENVFCFYKSG